MEPKTDLLSLARLNNGQLIEFLKGILAIILRFVPDPSVKLAGAQQEVQRRLARFEVLHKKSSGSDLSDELGEIDALRDQLLGGLFWVCDAFASNPLKPEGQKAARLLHSLLHNWGSLNDIRNMEYSNQTAAINGILKDFRTKPGAAEAAALVPVAHFTDDLSGLNGRFSEVYLQRSVLASTLDEPVSFDDLRVEVRPHYAALLRRVEHECDAADGAAPWPALIAAINEYTGQFRTVIAHRAKEKKPEA
ncbi:MAG: hypothetical protein EOO11_17935 [Chitinophagaceae bacterium]|nr:MAG: hypothetical protein EOO11_17935 [Chitinophagaceae bacterium]